MELITVFLLLGPGILMWWLEGDCQLSTREEIIKMVLKIIFNNFVILMMSYMALTMMYGYMAVNLSAEYIEGVGNSIFNISFVWKYGVMSCAFAVMLTIIKKVYHKCRNKRNKR